LYTSRDSDAVMTGRAKPKGLGKKFYSNATIKKTPWV
jgi:hypothetical protein